MKYYLTYSKRFAKNFKKLNKKDKEKTREILLSLANGKALEPKYKDHKLKGEYKDFRECHVHPDLLLIYQKYEDIMILKALDIGSHSELF